MPVILSVFDSKLGPRPCVTIPEVMIDAVVSKNVEEVSLTASDGEFYTREYPEFGLKTISTQFKIESKFSRGGYEVAQVSALITEENPPVDVFKARIVETVGRVKEIASDQPGFYNMPEIVQRLHDVMELLDRSMTTDLPSTSAYMVPTGMACDAGSIHVPRTIGNEMRRIAIESKKDHYFIVFRVERGSDAAIVAKIIPCCKDVLKVRAVAMQFNIDIIRKLGYVVNLPLLYTTGLCQEMTGKCSYEAYFSCDGIQVDETISEIDQKLSILEMLESHVVEIVPTFLVS